MLYKLLFSGFFENRMGQKYHAVLWEVSWYIHFLWVIMTAEGLTRRMRPLSSAMHPGTLVNLSIDLAPGGHPEGYGVRPVRHENSCTSQRCASHTTDDSATDANGSPHAH